MKKFALLVVLVCSLAFFAALSAFPAVATSLVQPTPFEKVSADGKRVFRFTPKSDYLREMAEAAVYTNTEPPKLVYSMENFSSFAYEHNFYFTEDMMSFAYVSRGYSENAIEFYSKGKLKKQYKIKDLAENIKIEEDGPTTWLYYQNPIVQDGKKLTVTTVYGLGYDFNISTGETYVEAQGGSFNTMWIPLAFAAAGCILVGGVVLLIVLLRRRRK
jgi:hypothetical protein